MTVQVYQPPQKQNNNASIGSLIGMGVGAYEGGPSGAAAGSQIGGTVGGLTQPAQAQVASIPTQQDTSPLARRQEAIASDPATQMRQGKIALNSMDEETRKAFEPVLDEGLRRAAQQRQQAYGYSNSAYPTQTV